MTAEQLMQPRYEVISNYLHSPYRIGDLLEISDIGTSFHCTTTKEFNRFTTEEGPVKNYFNIKEIEKYPHLFRRLEWWEKRSIEDMPEYMKYEENGQIDQVEKVVSWITEKEGGWCGFEYGEFEFGTRQRMSINGWIPATEKEYTDYINSKNNPC